MTETNTSVIENLKLMMEASAWDGKLELSDALANIEQLRAAIAQQAEQVQRTPIFTTGHCKEKAKAGGCQLHNLRCSYPACDRVLASAPKGGV